MKMMIKNKKGSTPVAVFFLTIMALVLVSTALFVFLTSEVVEEEVSSFKGLEEVYVIENKINFYVNQGGNPEIIANYLQDIQGTPKTFVSYNEGVVKIDRFLDDGEIWFSYEFDISDEVEDEMVEEEVSKDFEDPDEEKKEEIVGETTDILELGEKVNFEVNGEEHSMTLIEIFEDEVVLRFESNPVDIKLSEGEVANLDLNNDGYSDVSVEVTSVDFEEKRAELLRRMGYEERIPSAEEDLPEYKEVPKEEIDSEELTEEDMIEQLPSRPSIPSVSYRCDPSVYPISCGPRALHQAFRDLGEEVNLCKLASHEERQGGFIRTVGSVLDRRARDITWPGEICVIARQQGFDCERISRGNANRETMFSKSTKNSVVIARIVYPQKFWGFFNMQHYAVFDTNLVKKTGGREIFHDYSPSESEIKELYVISKRFA